MRKAIESVCHKPCGRLALGHYVTQLAAAIAAALPGAVAFPAAAAAAAGSGPDGSAPPPPVLSAWAVAAHARDAAARDLLERAWTLFVRHGLAAEPAAVWTVTVAPALQVTALSFHIVPMPCFATLPCCCLDRHRGAGAAGGGAPDPSESSSPAAPLHLHP